MSRYSKDSYTKIFDQLLSEELYFSSTFASETNIKEAAKKMLGKSLKMGYIALYYDLVVDQDLNVHFKIKDPGSDIISITLIYGS